MRSLFPALFLLIFCTTACCNNQKASVPPSIMETANNSIYYWKTVFKLGNDELSFIKRHNIGKIYLRMFDVIKDNYAVSPEEAVRPNATVRIDDREYYLLRDSLKDIEIVPTVYITLDALKAMNNHEGRLAENIVARVKNMCSYNALPNVKELQIDCDWTVSTEDSFFRLCDSLKYELLNFNLPWQLSSTIRLHQLARKTPNVDKGVLMVYNTGDFDNPDVRNSIIDLKDVEPYLKRLSKYSLPLDIAYPAYSWHLLFRKRKFVGLLRDPDVNDTAKFLKTDENHYIALKDIPHNNIIIRRGDEIRSENSLYKEVKSVKDLIERKMAYKQHSNILYHFDSENLSKFSDNEIETIFSSVN